MHLHTLTAVVPLLSTAVAAKFKPASTEGTDRLYREGLTNLALYEKDNSASETCSLQTASIRKEWGSLKNKEKTDYIAAVQCLQSKPAISGDLVPGARSRYDDFVGTHINQTVSIHGTVSSFDLDHPWVDITDTYHRVTFSNGTATSHGPMSRLFATNVATPATSHTSTGANTPKIC